jgi:hypothetical protein
MSTAPAADPADSSGPDPAPSGAAWYEPGDRWLVVAGRAMVVSQGTSADAVAAWRAAADGAGAGDLLLTLIRRSVAGQRWSDPGAFAVAVAEPGGVRVLARGIDGLVIVGANGSETPVEASGLVSWVETVVAGAVEVRIGAPDLGLLPVPVGVVRAGALRWGIPAQPTAGATPSDETAGPAPADETSVAAPSDEPGEAPEPQPDPAPGPQRSLEETRVGLDPEDLQRVDAGAPSAGSADRSTLTVPAEVIEAAETGVGDRPSTPATAAGRAGADPAMTGAAAAPAVAELAGPPAGPPEVDARGVPGDRLPPLERGPLPDRPPPPIVPLPPMSSAPLPPMSSAPASPGPRGPLSAVPEFPPPDPGDELQGDHDGMTQLAEDLPVGYTPPPLPAAPPPGSVLAVLCPVGHPNAPHSRSCRLCGQLIIDSEPVPVPRPVLARIRLSTRRGGGGRSRGGDRSLALRVAGGCRRPATAGRGCRARTRTSPAPTPRSGRRTGISWSRTSTPPTGRRCARPVGPRSGLRPGSGCGGGTRLDRRARRRGQLRRGGGVSTRAGQARRDPTGR